MIRKITALVAAAALAATAVAPAQARDYYRGHYRHGYYGHYHNGGDLAAVGVVGLVLGLALGSALSADRYDRGGCYNPCRYAPPPPPPQYRGYDPGRGGPPPQSYAPPPQGYNDDDGVSDGSAYEQDYGVDPKRDGARSAPTSCTHQERQWDRYANRYVTVDVPC